MVYSVDGADLDGAAFSRARKVLASASYQTDKPSHHFFDELSAARHAAISARLPDYEILPQSSSRDENKFIVAAYNDKTHGARYLYDASADSLATLEEINPALAQSDMAPVRPTNYPPRPRLTIT